MEKWRRNLKWEKPNKDFDWHIYINPHIKKDEARFESLKAIYKEYKQRRREIECDRAAEYKNFKLKWSNKYKKKGTPDFKPPLHLFKYDASTEYSKIDDDIIAKAKDAVPSASERANYAVELCYKNLSANKNFAWLVAGDAIARNIEQVVHKIPLEVHGTDFDFAYLGRKFIWATYPNAITPEEDCESKEDAE